MDGVLVVDKPEGLTSHDVVAVARRILGEKRIGHTGTLDPLATGVLPLACGRATRLVRFLTASDKEYDAVVLFGVTTDTLDVTGEETGRSGATPTRDALVAAIPVARIGVPEDIWIAVKFVIECDYFNGRTIDVDGGLAM
jgi:tRNA pseudouridine55 synthase